MTTRRTTTTTTQLALLPPASVPAQLRLDERTRRVGFTPGSR